MTGLLLCTMSRLADLLTQAVKPAYVSNHASALALACHVVMVNSGLRLRGASESWFRTKSPFAPPVDWQKDNCNEWVFVYYFQSSPSPITLTVNIHAVSGRSVPPVLDEPAMFGTACVDSSSIISGGAPVMLT